LRQITARIGRYYINTMAESRHPLPNLVDVRLGPSEKGKVARRNHGNPKGILHR
jgi:hypothetical protein